MSELKDKVAKSYRWRDYDHFEANSDYIDGDFIKAVNDVCRLEKEVKELNRQESLLDEQLSSFMKMSISSGQRGGKTARLVIAQVQEAIKQIRNS